MRTDPDAGGAWSWRRVRELLAAGRREECAQLHVHWPLALAGERGRALFAHFVDEGDAPAVQFLARRGAQVNGQGAARRGAASITPLTAAIYCHDVDTVRVLLSARARVDGDMVARAAWHRAPGGVVEALYSARAAEFARAVLLSVQRRHPRQYDAVRHHALQYLGYDAQYAGAQHSVTADFVRRLTECTWPSGASPLATVLKRARAAPYDQAHSDQPNYGANEGTSLKLVQALLRCRADVHGPVRALTDDRGGLRALETVAEYAATTLGLYAPGLAPKSTRRLAVSVRYFAASPACLGPDACTGMLGALGAAHAACVAHFAAFRVGPGFAGVVEDSTASTALPLPEALTHEELAAVNRLLLRGHARPMERRRLADGAALDGGPIAEGAAPDGGPLADGAAPDGGPLADDFVPAVLRALLRRGILGIHRVVPEQPTPLEAAVRGSQWAAARVMLEFALRPRQRATAAVAHRAVRACSLSAHCPADVRASVEEVERACSRLPHKRPLGDDAARCVPRTRPSGDDAAC
jgi:hypothetical protein